MVVHDRAKVGLLTSSPQAQLPIICVHFAPLGCICVHFGAFAIITYHLRSLVFIFVSCPLTSFNSGTIFAFLDLEF
jgi:hypothetical protein